MKLTIDPVYSFLEADEETLIKVRKRLTCWLKSRAGNHYPIYYFTEDGGLEFQTGFVQGLIKKGGILENAEIVNENVSLRHPLDFNFAEFELYPTQKRILKAVYENDRGVINAATNSGKSICMVGTLKMYGWDKVLIVVHKTELFDQLTDLMYKEFPTVKIGGVCSKYCTFGGITIAMYQSLKNLAEKDLKVRSELAGIDLLMADEVHRCAAKGYTELLSWVGAYHRFGFSGTPFDVPKQGKFNILGAFGSEIVKVTNEENIKLGVSMKPIIHFYKISGYTGRTFKQQLNESERSEERFEIIKQICLERKGKEQILIEVKHKDHLKFIVSRLKAEAIECTGMDGTLKAKERKELTDLIKSGELKIIVTTLFKEGLNAPNLSDLIRAASKKSTTDAKQFIGRFLRLDGENDEVRIHDFMDLGDKLLSHGLGRREIYKKEKFEIIYHYGNKNGYPI